MNSNGTKSCAFSVHAALSNQFVVVDFYRICDVGAELMGRIPDDDNKMKN